MTSDWCWRNGWTRCCEMTGACAASCQKTRAREVAVPTEFVEGVWRFPAEGSEPSAVVVYTEEPSPETGHVGWCWWALGRMGEAPTYEAACAVAVAEIQRRMDERMAVL